MGSSPGHCGVCGRDTRSLKPYCARHITLIPYPGQVAQIVEQSQEELRRGSINPYGHNAEEVLRIVKRYGVSSLGYLNGMSDYALGDLELILRVLVREGRIRKAETERMTLYFCAKTEYE